MQYDHKKSLAILEKTPIVLKALLGDLDDDWIMNNEGPETFSPFDVVGHLIHGEKQTGGHGYSVLLTRAIQKHLRRLTGLRCMKRVTAKPCTSYCKHLKI